MQRCGFLDCEDLYPDPPSARLHKLEVSLGKQTTNNFTIRTEICLEIKNMARKHRLRQEASEKGWPFVIDFSELLGRVAQLAQRLKDAMLDNSIQKSPVWTALEAGNLRNLRQVSSVDATFRARPG